MQYAAEQSPEAGTHGSSTEFAKPSVPVSIVEIATCSQDQFGKEHWNVQVIISVNKLWKTVFIRAAVLCMCIKQYVWERLLLEVGFQGAEFILTPPVKSLFYLLVSQNKHVLSGSCPTFLCNLKFLNTNQEYNLLLLSSTTHVTI